MGARRVAVLVAVVVGVLLAGAGSLAALTRHGGQDGAGAAAPSPAAPAASATPAAPAAPATPGAPTAEPAGRFEWYLALGDSLAAGYQPSNPGDRTDRDGGYAGIVRDELTAGQDAPPELVNLGCPGETIGTFTAGGRCPYAEGSQLAAAQAFLDRQPGDGAAGLVTVQVGANDVQRCLTGAAGTPVVDEACAATGLKTVENRLPALLETLSQAAPAARVVVLDYYNPFVAAALLGPRGDPLAVRSQDVTTQLNAGIAGAASGAGAAVARVGEAFAAPPPAPGATPTGPVVGQICTLTWMCGVGPDVHATSSGYAVMADRVLDAVRAG